MRNTQQGILLFLAFLFCSLIWQSSSLDNGLGLTPQMGWNSWNKFGCDINQQLIKRTADLLLSTGLADKGYKYVNLDDCWQISRNQTTKRIIEDKNKFPNGMKSLVDYVHSKGLKFGLYSDAGEKTCEGRPGSYGYQKIDAKTYAQWEVDYLKYDNCYNLHISSKLRYFAMYKALNQSGRHIFYSMCNWGQQRPWEWAGPIANSWRTTGDIQDNWKSFTSLLDQQVGLEVYAGKGGWNDPDMLQVGNGGMTNDQYLAHFTLWSVLKAPLLIGCSLQNMSQDILKILGNEQLIAINQDDLGIQASRIRRDVNTNGTIEVWGGPLANNKYVVVMFNRGEAQTTIEVDIKSQLKIDFDSYSARDVIRHVDLGIKTNKVLSARVRKHCVEALVFKTYKSSPSQALKPFQTPETIKTPLSIKKVKKTKKPHKNKQFKNLIEKLNQKKSQQKITEQNIKLQNQKQQIKKTQVQQTQNKVQVTQQIQ